MPRTSNRLIAPIIGVILGLIGLFVTGYLGPVMIMEAYASQSWPSTEGKVTYSMIDEDRDRKRGTSYSLILKYEFLVDDQQYEGDRWAVTGSPSYSSRSHVEQLQSSGHQVGDTVEVFYDPDNPTHSVLKTGGVQKAWLTLGMGVLVLGIGAFLILRWLVRRG